jgi:hypothetical protein
MSMTMRMVLTPCIVEAQEGECRRATRQQQHKEVSHRELLMKFMESARD